MLNMDCKYTKYYTTPIGHILQDLTPQQLRSWIIEMLPMEHNNIKSVKDVIIVIEHSLIGNMLIKDITPWDISAFRSPISRKFFGSAVASLLVEVNTPYSTLRYYMTEAFAYGVCIVFNNYTGYRLKVYGEDISLSSFNGCYQSKDVPNVSDLIYGIKTAVIWIGDTTINTNK